MKKSTVKAVSISLCAVLALGGMGGAVYALAAGGDTPQPVNTSSNLTPGTEAEAPLAKDETVYVLTGTDGAVKKIIVSDWLKNPAGSAALMDSSLLTDVENVKGSEGYTMDSGSSRVWDAQGNDIYCQGSIDKELPVDLSVAYLLDGKAISPAELAGKSGKVTIRFEYTNRQYDLVEINGKEEKIYVPFAMLTGLLLDNETFSNVEVSNGKIYNDGDRTAVIGLAFPGLQENLALDAGRLEIPDYVEITADVENFELGNTVTLAAGDVFGSVDTSELDSMEDLGESLSDLTDAMDQLMDGSSALYDGLCTLLDRSGELVDGINQLTAGMQALQNGAGDLAAGAQALQTGSGDLAEGVQAVQGGIGSLAEGAGQLQDGAANLQTGLDALTASSEQINGGARQVFDTLLASTSAQLASAGLDLPALTAENYETVLDGVIASMPQGSESVAALKASLDNYNVFYQGLQSYTAGVAEAAGGAGQLTNGAANLADGAEQLQEGAAGLTGGAEQLRDGAASLAGGAEQLSDGIDQVSNGANQLQAGAPALVDGITQLRDGAMQLSDGLKEFNEKGVQKLVDAVDGDLGGLIDRIQATADVSKNYRSFSGLSDGMDGQVKFVYRTDSIEMGE